MCIYMYIIIYNYCTFCGELRAYIYVYTYTIRQIHMCMYILLYLLWGAEVTHESGGGVGGGGRARGGVWRARRSYQAIQLDILLDLRGREGGRRGRRVRG